MDYYDTFLIKCVSLKENLKSIIRNAEELKGQCIGGGQETAEPKGPFLLMNLFEAM